jgi:hypothetical protein
VHEAEELAGEASNLSYHGFDLAQRLCEPLVVDVLRLIAGKLPPSHKPAERATCRRTRDRSHGNLDQRRLALRRQQAHDAVLHRGTIAGIASLSDFQPCCRLGDGGLLEQPVEQHSSRTRTSAVEPEGEFVEV